MVDAKLLIEKLIKYSKTFLGLNEIDETYTRNILLGIFKQNAPYNGEENLDYIANLDVPDELINEIISYCLENNIYDNETEADLFANYIFGILTPNPSTINDNFNNIKENLSSKDACDYLYNMSIKNYYIRKTAISKNLMWNANELNIPLEITINLSKPEKNNKDIAKLLTQKTTEKYPKCALCIENEGFYGALNHPPRTNLRTISINLNNEKWYLQYSPYAYFEEHCIVFNKEHTPMRINGDTIEKLLDFIDQFPHYFVGSNSDLPIVGGSILNHEHYQGGNHKMALMKAKALKKYVSDSYKDVEIEVVNFYNSVIRLHGFNRNTVSALAGEIITAWKNYTDESVGIYANINGEQHSTVTPIARFLDNGHYCVELILRNNITTEQYPDGVYHAHPEYHNIKKEGIGLIEAMGLYILPGRLKRQFTEIADFLVNKEDINSITEESPLFIHKDMIKSLMNNKIKTTEDANKYIVKYVNDVCKNILINTAVFKSDKAGKLAFSKFLSSIGIIED